VRVGIIGAGFGRRVAAPVFSETPGCDVVDVVSARDEAAVARLCARPDLDLVSVHSPPFRHAAHTRAAIDAGHAVLCDKPVGLNADETTHLLDAAAGAGVVHLVNFEFRHDPMRRALRDLVVSGRLGPPAHMTWVHLSSGSRVPLRPFGWLFRDELGGGWIRAWASHAVDTVRWLFGEITDAEARRRLDVTERPAPDGAMAAVDVEDGLSAWLRTDTGATVTLESTFAAPASLPPRIVVQGATGVAECVADTGIVVRDEHGGRTEEKRPPADGDPHLEPMRRWAEVVRDVVDGNRPATGPDVPTFADAVACARVLDQLRAAPLEVRL